MALHCKYSINKFKQKKAFQCIFDRNNARQKVWEAKKKSNELFCCITHLMLLLHTSFVTISKLTYDNIKRSSRRKRNRVVYDHKLDSNEDAVQMELLYNCNKHITRVATGAVKCFSIHAHFFSEEDTIEWHNSVLSFRVTIWLN